MCDPATLVTSAIAVGGQIMSSRSANKANDANTALAQQNQQLARDTQARNEQLTLDQQAQNTALLTGARDAAGNLLTTNRDQVGNLYQGTALANQGLLEGNRAQNFDVLAGTRDANTITNAQERAVQDNIATNQRDFAVTQAQQANARNQAVLDGTTQGITAENRAARDANTALYTNTGAQNQADILSYSDKARGAIESAQNDARNMYSPYVTIGGKATDAISALLGLGGDTNAQNQAFQNFRDSTGYQFQVNEAERGVLGNQAALGLLESGAAAKALSDRRQNMANASFGDYYGRLAGQQAVGLNATDSLTSRLASSAGDLANIYSRTGSDLTTNRDRTTSGLAGTNTNYLSGMTDNIRNYQAGTVNNNNALLANTTNATNTAADALTRSSQGYANNQLNAQNTFSTGVQNNNNNYLAGMTGNNNALLGGLTDNLNGYTQNMANLQTGTANSLAGLNTASTGALIGGNNALLQNLTQGNGQIMQLNAASGQNNADMWGGITNTLGGLAGNALTNFGKTTTTKPRTNGLYGPV